MPTPPPPTDYLSLALSALVAGLMMAAVAGAEWLGRSDDRWLGDGGVDGAANDDMGED